MFDDKSWLPKCGRLRILVAGKRGKRPNEALQICPPMHESAPRRETALERKSASLPPAKPSSLVPAFILVSAAIYGSPSRRTAMRLPCNKIAHMDLTTRTNKERARRGMAMLKDLDTYDVWRLDS